MERVSVGFFSFTEITDAAEHRTYNEWHQLDHVPEQYALRGVVHGERWVATPACRTGRLSAEPVLGAAHYMTLYLMSEPIDETLEAFWQLGRRLREQGRFHRHRRSLLSGPFEVTFRRAADRVLVSAEVVPWRPTRGVYVVVEDESRSSREPPPATGQGGPGAVDPTTMTQVPGVAGVWGFRSISRRSEDGPLRHWRPGNTRITVCYLDDDPLEVAPAMGRALVSGSAASREHRGFRLAGPLLTITPWRWDWFEPRGAGPRGPSTAAPPTE